MHDYAKPDTMGVLWGIKSIEDLPVSTVAVFVVIVSPSFLCSNFKAS